MLRLLGLVLSIGLADSLNPGTIGPALYLASGECPRRSVLEFTAAVFAIFTLGGVLLTLGPGRAILALVPHPNATTRYILETIAGAAMLVVAAWLWRRRGRLGADRGQEPEPKRRSPILLGAGISLVEFPTAFPYIAVIVAIVGSGVGLGRQLLLVVIYCACFVAPLLAIALIVTVAGERAVERLVRARKLLHRQWPVIAAAIALVVGVFVIALGITGLTGRVNGPVGRVSRGVRRVISH